MSTAGKLDSGTRVRVVQQVSLRDETWQEVVEGEVLAHGTEPTGSWFAHGRNDRLWLDRLRLRKDDGEITSLVLDRNSRVEVLARPGQSDVAAPQRAGT